MIAMENYNLTLQTVSLNFFADSTLKRGQLESPSACPKSAHLNQIILLHVSTTSTITINNNSSSNKFNHKINNNNLNIKKIVVITIAILKFHQQLTTIQIVNNRTKIYRYLHPRSMITTLLLNYEQNYRANMTLIRLNLEEILLL
jgi:hypothetical protein